MREIVRAEWECGTVDAVLEEDGVNGVQITIPMWIPRGETVNISLQLVVWPDGTITIEEATP